MSEHNYNVPAELFNGEIVSWPLGICEVVGYRDGSRVEYREVPREVRIFGENGFRIATVDLTNGGLSDWQSDISEAVRAEMEAL